MQAEAPGLLGSVHAGVVPRNDVFRGIMEICRPTAEA